jgi:hypothetical protein
MDDYEDTAPEIEGTPMERAMEQWKHGWTIPLTLAAELIEEGYNVAALEAQYRN